MPLTDTQARKALPGDKDYKLADSGGLYLFVTTKGFKSWRLKYRYAGKEKRLVIGAYPEVSLTAARAVRDRARGELRVHKDPVTEERKREAAAHAAAGMTFEIVAERWHKAQLGRWSQTQATKVRQAMERDVYPAFGSMPLTDIDGPTVIAMLRKVEARGAIDTSKRIRQHVSAVFGFGMAEGLCHADPAGRHLLRGLLPTPIGGSQPGVSTVAAARALQAKMDAATAGPLTKLASRILALTVVRPGIVPLSKWTEFEGIDWDSDEPAPDALWRISAKRMKLDMANKADDAFEHVVPLARQAVDVLRAVHRLSGRFPHPFHSVRSTHQPMSNSTIGVMYQQNGYSGIHVPHGWRTSWSTIMNGIAVLENRPLDRGIIDAMLAHKPKGISGSEMAYNRQLHWPRRRELAQEWADMITEGLVPPNDLLAGRERAG